MISGNIEVLTGMHIGGGNEFSAIGAIDSPVIKDPEIFTDQIKFERKIQRIIPHTAPAKSPVLFL